ncbi:conserved Plasmodium protein, unknown function [Plasmodium ovale wallikeri]|uniref:tRNA-intron lyase n=2 Tax=Plasmodium ovale TaxID=36330 RepID=A0A1A9A322_PLAOA|nr:conserved Plasmodium protein, unknown function [Plasmodium ovale wallikeri]SBT50850.1 conserved Plasmodium protein, unknown function [Plasmodium ovale wallikeri]SBT82797.1 conserved Plasmodium protein, unknown function [Plasmodium ovale]
MKVIYEWKGELYELLLNEGNIDERVIQTLEKNVNKWQRGKTELPNETNVDLLNFEQFSRFTGKGKKHYKKGESASVRDKWKEEQKSVCPFNDEREEDPLDERNDTTKLLLKYKSYFTEAGYYVKRGDLYGAEYLLYLAHQKYTHSLYVVYFVSKQNVLRDLIRILRLSHTIKKKVILLLERDFECPDIFAGIVYIKVYAYKLENEKGGGKNRRKQPM